MAIDLRSVTAGINDGSSKTVSVTTSESPSATRVGDLVVVIHSNDYFTASAMPTPTATGAPTLSAITGGSVDGGSNNPHIKSYTYVANTAGAQVVSTTETGLADEEKMIVVRVLGGADATTPVDVAGGTSLDSNGTSHVLSGVTTTENDSYLIGHIQTVGDFNGGTWSSPGSMSETYDTVVGSMSATGADQQLSASGATGTRTFTSSVNHQMIGVLIAVKAAAAAAALPKPPVVAPSVAARQASAW